MSMLRSASLLVAILVAACDDDGPPLPPADASDVPVLPWWTPEPGEARNWDIQLHAPFDVSEDRQMYLLELFTVVPSAQTMTYDDSSTVNVPAGALPTAIADLHARGAKVVCRVGTGAIRLSDPDAMKFPGFEASPPDEPNPPAAGSVIAWSTDDPNEPDERFINTGTASRSVVLPLIEARYALAKAIGCDAIDADHSLTLPAINPGFEITQEEQITWDLDVANLAHAKPLELAIGLRNGFFVSDDTRIIEAYDFALMERLVESEVCCDELRPFINRDKEAFAIDYAPLITTTNACSKYATAQVDGILKDEALSSTTREECPAP